MATYTITIDDTLVPGLTKQLGIINAQNTLQRQPQVPDIQTMITNATVGLANQGLNAIHDENASIMAAALAAGKTPAEAAALINN